MPFAKSHKSTGHCAGVFESEPVFEPLNEGGRLLDVRFEHSIQLWPWSGFLALYIQVRPKISHTRQEFCSAPACSAGHGLNCVSNGHCFRCARMTRCSAILVRSGSAATLSVLSMLPLPNDVYICDLLCSHSQDVGCAHTTRCTHNTLPEYEKLCECLGRREGNLHDTALYYAQVMPEGGGFSGTAEGQVSFTIVSQAPRGDKTPRRSIVRVPLSLPLIPTPPPVPPGPLPSPPPPPTCKLLLSPHHPRRPIVIYFTL